MRKGVVVCGANGERGHLIEMAIAEFAPRNASRIVQFSACTVGLSPIMLQMSGVEMDKLVSVNGCRMRCCDRIMEKAGLKPEKSIVIDDVVSRNLAPCETASSMASGATKEEAKAFAVAMEKAL
jgi:uncharacterized metal-binding protein